MSIPESEQRKVCTRSGDRCAFPDCRRVLTADGAPPDRIVILGEIAHIVAERIGGPRGNSSMSLADRNRTENLLLLCNNHHQLIDAQPETYPVERLRGIKESHEAWVEKTLGKGIDDGNRLASPPLVTEVVHSTLLPVDRMPPYIYGAPYELSERDVQAQLGRFRGGEMTPYIVRERMLYAFQNLGETGNPFEQAVVGQPVERFHVEEWWGDPDRLRWFVQLLNRTLNKLTGRRGVSFDKEHRRYYFAPEVPGSPFSVSYRPLNKRQASRQVVWQPIQKSTGEPRPYWLHRAVGLRFLQTGRKRWAVSIRPELRITTDGVNPPPSETVGGRVTRKKSRTFNYNLLAEVHFWRDYLSGSQPRIVLPFGSASQAIVVSTSLMRGDVVWPGIPKEHAKSFKNVEYVDDLFSWAEFQSFKENAEERDDDEWLEEEEENDDSPY